MTHKKIRIPRESANEIMRALGSLKNAVEFEDLTKDDLEAKKNFSEMIKRCDEIKKRILDFSKVCYDFHLPYNYYKTFSEFQKDINDDMKKRDKKFGLTYFDLIESEILENDKKINELVDSHSQTRDNLVTLIEKKHVLLKAEELIRTNYDFSQFSEVDPGEDGIKQGMGSDLSFMAGVINIENELKMKRMIFRISRGRAITAFYSLEINNDEYLLTSSVRERGLSFMQSNLRQPGRYERLSSLIQSKDVGTFNTKKKIFTIIFTGSAENILLQKLLKVCEIFQASRYPVPKNSEITNEINKIEEEIKLKKNLMVSIERTLLDFCTTKNIYENKKGYKYSLYKLFFDQEKMVYTALNKCIVRDTFVDGQIWIPTSELPQVNALLQNLFTQNDESQNKQNKSTAYLEDLPLDEDSIPPTLILTNEFTDAFQQVVNTYGIPRYREINPGYFTIITFPFLFGIMYGDIGHGLILLLFALYLCIFNKSLSKGSLKGFLFARYFLLLMGIFATYCGLLYNDFLSIPVDAGSCYDRVDKNKGEWLNRTLFKDSDGKENYCSYKFGLDPVWYITSNELAFVNSLKMKISVIFGVFQMIIGIVLKGFNAIHEKEFSEFIFIFCPQLIMMIIMFGYMDFLIFVKWNTTYECNFFAPDIKSYLMNIFLKFGEIPSFPNITWNITDPVCQNYLGITQGEQIDENKAGSYDWKLLTERNLLEKIHRGIFIACIIIIILMLVPKIIIDYFNNKKKIAISNIQPQNILEQQNEENQVFQEDFMPQRIVKDEPPKGLSDFIVAGAIETIEFVLGTVSNTASYLRLWALSLAHSQLAQVFFNKTVVLVGNATGDWYINAFLLAVVFPIFAGITGLVLLFMDLMECFLHTLRLHWVEFQNKFFRADGYEFKPFCFEQNLDLKEDDFEKI